MEKLILEGSLVKRGSRSGGMPPETACGDQDEVQTLARAVGPQFLPWRPPLGRAGGCWWVGSEVTHPLGVGTGCSVLLMVVPAGPRWSRAATPDPLSMGK